MAMKNSTAPLMDRRYRDIGDVLAHVAEQAALAVRRVNEGRTYTDEQFKAAVERTRQAMLGKLIRDLEAMGRGDLAGKITKAQCERWFTQDMADLKRAAENNEGEPR